MIRHKSFAALLGIAALAACSYEKTAVQDITGVDPGARVRFFNFGVNAPSVNFYGNTAKLTAISSTPVAAGTFVTGLKYTIVTLGAPCPAAPASCPAPPTDFTTIGAASNTINLTFTATGPGAGTGTAVTEAVTGVAYGAGGAGSSGVYSAIAPGSYTFTGKIVAVVDKDLSISPVTATIEANKFYSYYMSGFYNTTSKTVESFVIEDPLPPDFDYTVAHVRFVNAISNSTPMTLFAKAVAPSTAAELTIGGAIAYKGAGVFVAIPAGVYDLNTRTTAAPTTNAIPRTAVSFSAGRVYTITGLGDMTVTPFGTSGTATNRARLDNTLNR